MPHHLRPYQPETDLPRLAELMSAVRRDPVTVEILADRERAAPAETLRQRLVAVDARGSLAGYGSTRRDPWDPPGKFWLSLLVDPPARREGIGSALYDALAPFLAEQGATCVEARAREDEPESLLFAEERGFRIARQTFESVLDVPGFDPAPFAGRLEQRRAEGFRFFSFAETDQTPEQRRRLYDLNVEAGRDEPSAGPGWSWPFEQFERDVFEASWFRAGGQIFAAEGDHWVGLAAVGEEEPGRMFNAFTGVRRGYRGRGLALALKLLAIDFCRRSAARTLRTHNDSENAPMLAVNRRLGYVPAPGWYTLRRE